MSNSGGDVSETVNNPLSIQQLLQQSINQQQDDRSRSLRTTDHASDIGTLLGFGIPGHIIHQDSELKELRNSLVQVLLEVSRNQRQWNDDAKEMRNDAKEMRNDLKQMRDEIRSKEQEIYQLKTTIVELTAENKQLREEVKALQKHAERYDRENTELKNRMSRLEVENEKLRADFERIQVQIRKS